ncbi:MAG: MurR/RpiR family transcriptional regulator [Sulfitobacter dubius]|uniref:MurR/RpiR family transcriptional regulator n=1 Tax=Sulfitobacter dubius TaxID=218673 RepID=UPI0008E9AD96|nr:MurR/RpiR family transcriptional regulator [Sulfitobacter dubius]SFH34286.1 transcriptional regulator, RpiR family [Sulfitobacter dubius]
MAGNYHSEVAQRIAATYETLSPAHRKIADFILQNPTTAALLNNVELASRCVVSTATATRFARAIGYSQFSEFRDSQIETMRKSESHATRLTNEIDESAGAFDVVNNGLDQDCANLEATRHRLDEGSCTNAVEMILRAERIFAFGAGVSQFVCGVLIHGLEPYCRGSAFNIGPLGNGSSAMRQVLHCQPGDLVVVCSLPHYSSDTIEVAETARARGADLLCITDRPTSPLSKHGHVTFYADAVRRLLPNSITSAVAVAEGIIAAVANRRSEGMDVHRVLDARTQRSAQPTKVNSEKT